MHLKMVKLVLLCSSIGVMTALFQNCRPKKPDISPNATSELGTSKANAGLSLFDDPIVDEPNATYDDQFGKDYGRTYLESPIQEHCACTLCGIMPPPITTITAPSTSTTLPWPTTISPPTTTTTAQPPPSSTTTIVPPPPGPTTTTAG